MIPEAIKSKSQQGYFGYKVKISLDWQPVFDFIYQVTGWHPVELNTTYLHTREGQAAADMQWNLLVHPSTTLESFGFQIAGALKYMSNKRISDDFNSFVLALMDNRPSIAER